MTRLVGILLILLAAGPGAAGAQEADQTEAYIVYATVLQELYVQNDIDLLVIRTETKEFIDREAADHLLESWQDLHGLTARTVEKFLAASAHSIALESRFGLPTRTVLLNAETFEAFFRNGVSGWKDFYREYPDSSGLITFSNVGFNAEAGQALVYVERTCGPRCGGGRLVLLRLSDERWIVEAVRDLWAA